MYIMQHLFDKKNAYEINNSICLFFILRSRAIIHLNVVEEMFLCISGTHFQDFPSFFWESLLHASLKYSLRMLPSLHLLSRVELVSNN